MAKDEKLKQVVIDPADVEILAGAPQMKAKDLRATHPDYNLREFECFRDIIDGGPGFHQNIDRYISKLRADKLGITLSPQTDLENPFPAGNFKGAGEHATKVSLTYHVPHALGVFNHIAGSVADDPPKIENVNPDAAGFDPYYFKLAENMKAQTRENVKRILQYGHPYISITFPKTGALNMAQAEERGAKDAELNLVHPIDVLDWECDGEDLIWCKICTITMERKNEYGPADTICETYTFATPKDKRIYKIRYKIGHKGDVKDEDIVEGIIEPHEFNACPVVRVALDDDLWAAKHLEGAIKKLINLEADMSLYVKKVAHPILTAPDANARPKVVKDSIDCLTYGKLEYVHPSSDAFMPMRQEKQDAKRELFDCLSSLAQIEAGKSHVSPEVAEKEREPYNLLAKNYAQALKNAYTKILLLIQRVRNQSGLALVISGLRNPTTEGLADRLKSLLDINQVPDFLPLARRWQIVKSARDICRDIPQQFQSELDKQIFQFMTAPMAVVPPTPTTGDNDEDGDDVKPDAQSEYNKGDKIPDLSKPEKIAGAAQPEWPTAGGPPGRS